MKTAAAALAALALAIPSAIAADATQLGVGYICGAERAPPGAGPQKLVMLTGLGNGASPADTADREAQAWYAYGLNAYHAFNHEEAKQGLAHAAALDPGCALCEWAVALSLGPTLNYGIGPDQRAQALTHLNKAAALAKSGDDRARGLIAALRIRYAKDTPDAQREKLYAKAMDALVRRYPGDNEIANQTIHTLLIPARADDYSGVPRALEIIRTVLARKPDDTAAIHYDIHATEFAGHAADALPYAEKLAGLAPGASHLVHMAAHTLMRVGRYEQVAVVDAQALAVDARVRGQIGYAGPLSAQRYYLHNYSFGLAGALMAGDARLALKYADHAAIAFPAAADADRRALATAKALVAYGRFAPARALAIPENPGDRPFVQIYRHYARGEAFATRGDTGAMLAEAKELTALETTARAKAESGNADLAAIAADVLSGRAALMQRRPQAAAALFTRAAERQEKFFPVFKNFDPPPWWYPVRRSLALAELRAGHSAEAARQARLSLKDWPNDALALRVLATAETRLGQPGAARRHLAQARKAWRGDLRQTPLTLT